MSRTHYRMMAKTLSFYLDDFSFSKTAVIALLSDLFNANNDRFNKDVFEQACRHSAPQGWEKIEGD